MLNLTELAGGDRARTKTVDFQPSSRSRAACNDLCGSRVWTSLWVQLRTDVEAAVDDLPRQMGRYQPEEYLRAGF